MNETLIVDYKNFLNKTVDKCRPLWYNSIVLERVHTKNFILRIGEINHDKNRKTEQSHNPLR